jgi:phage tail-like protein
MDGPGFMYLNLDNAWPSFALTGLSVANDGILTLAPLPGGAVTVTGPATVADALEGPAGIGVDEDGNLYIADPTGNQILRWEACSGQVQPLPCLGGEGSLPGQLETPRGVLVGPRQALYVADSGNHRIQIVDLRTLQLRGIWGQPDPYAPPQPDNAPGRFNDPWDLAADARGNLYVVDHGNRRVQKLDADGEVIPAFWQTMLTQPVVPQEPAYIITGLFDVGERLLVIDRAQGRVLVYATDGTYDAQRTATWPGVLLGEPGEIVFAGNTLYVGDAAANQVLTFGPDGSFLGALSSYAGTVAGLSLDREGRLLINAGAGGAVTSLAVAAAYGQSGSFLAGPFNVSNQDTRWHRLQVMAAPLPARTHLRLFTYTSESPTSPAPPDPSVIPPGDVALTALDTWRCAPHDATDLLVLNEPAPYLWVAGLLHGDGSASPAIYQMRLDYDHESWLRFLPALYRTADVAGPQFLERALSLFESLLGDVDVEIDDLPLHFDPWAAPDRHPASWLDWLAGWLDFPLDQAWPDAVRRQTVANAFRRHSLRGTVAGLQQLVRLYTGARAYIEEPARFAHLWSLGDKSVLGFDTMLAPAEAQGAVLGTTAILDQSHLIGDEEYGAPLFADVAHRFCVRMYAAELADPATVDTVRAVVDREKPAHTVYHLCPIEARMRVGFQALVGIDSIVAGPPPDMILGSQQQLGQDMVLPAAPAETDLGSSARLGLRTTLS